MSEDPAVVEILRENERLARALDEIKRLLEQTGFCIWCKRSLSRMHLLDCPVGDALEVIRRNAG